jgi:hypothetical protein
MGVEGNLGNDLPVAGVQLRVVGVVNYRKKLVILILVIIKIKYYFTLLVNDVHEGKILDVQQHKDDHHKVLDVVVAVVNNKDAPHD